MILTTVQTCECEDEFCTVHKGGACGRVAEHEVWDLVNHTVSMVCERCLNDGVFAGTLEEINLGGQVDGSEG